ncbi:MAG: Crp/Fnr family transcriptional regulator [Bdellovibrionaceae bacterium]|nr:Crp/Fnr family transcriptional regulator [Pseudobdellovibrionaceae bacterium]
MEGENVGSSQVRLGSTSSDGYVILSRGQNANGDGSNWLAPEIAFYGHNVIKLKAGELIFRAGDRVQGIYFLKSGLVKVLRKLLTPKGRMAQDRFLCEILGSRTYFGCVDFFTGSYYQYEAVTLQPSEVVFIEKNTFQTICEKNPSILRELLRQAFHHIKDLETRLDQQYLASVGERIAHVLLDLGERFGESTPQGIVINLKLTRSEFAQLAGTINESLSRHLGELQKEGIIEVQGKKITIRDTKRLEGKLSYPTKS